jgi:hypothetical protein
MIFEELNGFCRGLPATTYVVQWGGSHVWKVGGKVFAIGGWEDDEPGYTFKVTRIVYARSSIVFVASRLTVNPEGLGGQQAHTGAATRHGRASRFFALLRDRLLTGKLHQFNFAGFERGKRPFKLCDLLVDGA